MPTTKNFSPQRLAPLALTSALLLSGCSLLFRPSADQCVSDADCTRLGSAFKNMTCVASACVKPSGSGGSTGSGGGGGAASECTTNVECIEKNFEEPYACIDGSCVALTIPKECPIVLGAGPNNENLKRPSPIIIGAYSYVNPDTPRLSAPTLNYELAIDEFNDKTRGGLSGGKDGTPRPIVAVVCSATNSPDLDLSSSHLIEKLRVPAVISSLFSKDLRTVFQSKARQNKVFFLSPLEADSTLTSEPDDGLLWHMLGASVDLAPAYVPLLSRAEAHLRATRGLADTTPIRVAFVGATTPFLTDISDYLADKLVFNGKSAIENAKAGNYLSLRTDSSIEIAKPDVSVALQALKDFVPDVIVSAGSSEFVGLMFSLENDWPVGNPKPFYLVSPYVFGLGDLAGPSLSTTRSRLLGVNFAANTDTAIYDLYLARLKSAYQVGLVLDGTENFYDAAYFMVYSIAGAGNPPRLTGKEVALGMTRLLTGDTRFDVGPSSVANAVSYLGSSADSTFQLVGAMGAPNFNTSTGARKGVPSIYCIDSSGTYVQNAMLYENNALVGSPSCIGGF